MKIKIFILVIATFLISCRTTIPEISSIRFSEKDTNVPEIFGDGVICKKDKNVFNLCFSPDGKTVYFTRREGTEKQKIYFSVFENQKWTEPKVASFSTDRDETPFITPDGKTLYFGSQRPIPNAESSGNFDMNIWKTEWKNNKWNEPTPISKTINKIQIEKEAWPSSNENSIFTNDGIHFYFATMLRGTKSIEIYETKYTKKEFSTPIKISGFFDNDKYWKSTPIISADGNYLFFNAYDVIDGKGGEDIYVSKKINSGWSKAKNIGALINTKAEEGSARFSPDGKYFFFGREIKENPEKDGIWSIYYIQTKYIEFEKLFNN